MILEADLKAVGKFLKPHGVNGEINFYREFEDLDLESFSCLIVDIDGIFVPFFLTSVRPRGAETDLVAIDGIDDELHAARLTNKIAYVLRAEIQQMRKDASDDENSAEDGFYADDFVGFKVVLASDQELGEITRIDDSTANYLFELETPQGAKLLIPIADEFITSIEPDKKIVEMDLPEGLLEMQ